MCARAWPGLASRECRCAPLLLHGARVRPASRFLAALRTHHEFQEAAHGAAERPAGVVDRERVAPPMHHPGGRCTCMTTGCGTARATASCAT